MTESDPNSRDDSGEKFVEPPTVAPTSEPTDGEGVAQTREFVQPAGDGQTRDYRETPGLGGPTADFRASSQGLRNAPTIPGFQIIEELGKGGMGVVYKARQLGLKRFVALKMIRARCADSRALARFRAEAAAAARLQHPNIVQVYEIGEQDGEPYFALEYLPGGSLAQRLDRTPQPARASAALIESIARAVHVAHEKGIVHRDLKPANILLDSASDAPRSATASSQTTSGGAPSGGGSPTGSQSGALRSTESSGAGVWGRAVAKIADFGIAKHLDGEEDEPAALRTETGAILGTPSYMAPEQAAGRSDLVGPATDVYALGAILYELLTGKAPFLASTAVETVHQVLTQEPAAPRKFAPRTPRDLETICLKCLEKARERRYSSALELADDLRRFLDGEPIKARPAAAVDRLVKWCRKRPGIVTGIICGVIFLGLAAGVGGWAWDSYYRTKVEFYHSLVMLSGEPVPIGKLTPEESQRRQVSYRLTRKGDHIESVALVNGLGKPTTADSFFNVALILGDDGDQESESSFDFHASDSGQLLESTARNVAGDFIWRLHFTTDEMAHYTDARGFPKARSASGATYVQFVHDDKQGSPSAPRKVRFLDRNGISRCNASKVFGVAIEFEPNGLPKKLTYLNAKDEPTRHKQGMTSVVLAYDERGRMTQLQALDADDAPVMLDAGFSGGRFTYDAPGNCTAVEYIGADGRPRRQLNGYARVRRTYDERGLQTKIVYEDVDGQPVLSNDAVAGELREFNEHGWILERKYLGVDGRPTINRYGVAAARMKYDERGRQLEEYFVDLEGNPTWPSSGKSGVRYAYDDEGRVTATTTLGVDGKPTPGTNGFATSCTEYDVAGNAVRIYYLDTEGKPTRHADGEWEVRSRFDDHGKSIEDSYCDAEGRLVMTGVGFARVEYKYDDDGNIREWLKWDANGAPAMDSDGAHRVVAEYDELRNKTAYRAFGGDGRPTMIQAGYASWKAKYDPYGNPIEQAFFDAAGKPTLHTSGYARRETDYDERNNAREIRNFGVDGKLVGERDVAITRYERDDVGRSTAESNFDATGAPVANDDGCHRITFKYDARGREIERRYFGPDGKPTAYRGGGNHIWRREFDSLGRMVVESYFDEEDRPIDSPDGFAIRRYTYDAWGRTIAVQYFEAAKGDAPPRPLRMIRRGYDARGNETDWACFTPEGKPTTWGSAWHRLEDRYDDRNHRIERRQFGVDGQLLQPPEAAVVKYENDALGRAVATSYFDPNGKPIENSTGVHRDEAVFDYAGHEIERRYIDAEGKPARYSNVGNSIWRRVFDVHGRVSQESFHDAEGKLLNLVGSGFAIVRYTRDAWGNPIEKRYYDKDDKPTGGADGIFTLHARYDVRGYWTEMWAADVEQKPMLLSSGVYRRKREVDATGQVLWSASFDADGQPMTDSDGVHREEATYDAGGREIERKFFNAEGQPARFASGGNSSWKKQYNAQGHVIEETYYDADGKLMLTEGGQYAIARYTRDSWGNAIEAHYFDVDGQPTGGSDGVHHLQVTYDLRGRWESVKAFGVDGRPTLLADGSYQKNRKLDAVGNVLRIAYFNGEGQPMLARRGCHIEETDYDAEGLAYDLRWFDVDGSPLETLTFVASVSPEGQGAKIGLQPGDVLIEYDGRPVVNREQWSAARRTHQPGEPPRILKWLRNGEVMSAETQPGLLGVNIDIRPKPKPAPPPST